MSSTPRHVTAAGGGAPSPAEYSTVEFAELARLLAQAARRRGLEAPSFRCPPRRVGVDRTIRRHGAAAVVAVRIRSRTGPAVIADMIEGIVVSNRLEAPDADRARNMLWDAVVDAGWLGIRPSAASGARSSVPATVPTAVA